MELFIKLKRRTSAQTALAILAVLIFTVVFADIISPYSRGIQSDASARLLPPGREHLFGTDEFGRDLFTRIIHGGRFSLALSFIPTVISAFSALLLGCAAVYSGGKFDEILTRLIDAALCVPGILLSLAIAAALGPGFLNLMAALTIAQIPHLTRIIRQAALAVVDSGYIDAAKEEGAGHWRIIRRHVMRNTMGPVFVQAAFSSAGMILLASGLSFVGLGAQPPAPEWGAMLAGAREYVRRAPHLAVFPGACILLTALCFNLLGDSLRDAWDPSGGSPGRGF